MVDGCVRRLEQCEGEEVLEEVHVVLARRRSAEEEKRKKYKVNKVCTHLLTCTAGFRINIL